MGASIGIIGWLIIGGLAGWIASKIMGTDENQGIFGNVAVGVVGAIIGGWVLNLVGVDVAGGGRIFSFFAATFGAVILLWILGKIRSKR